MNSAGNSPKNNEIRTETSGGSYDAWQKAMSRASWSNSPDRTANKTEKIAELSDYDAMDKLFRTLNAEHKKYLQTGDIKEYGGSLDHGTFRIDLHDDVLSDQMNMLTEAYNKLNDPEEYGNTDTSLTDVITFMVNDKMLEWQKYEDEYGRSNPHTEELRRAYDIADDLLDRFKATKTNSDSKISIVNRPYIRKETINTVVDRDGNDGMRMEEMPAGKSEDQIERERADRVKIDNEMQARMETYWAEKRANEQKQREEQERAQEERAKTESERQRILQEQREKVQNAYRQNTENELSEEQDDEMEMGM